MILCEHCNSKNSLDGQFCKGCGREIPEESREIARNENTKLIADGYSMLGEGRTEEAELIAKTVLEADETVLSAWSLLGMVYERKGEWVGALDCYERVLQQNPDSALDKIKVTQLKNSIQRQIQPEVKPNKKFAFATAAAAVVFTVSAGAILASLVTRPAAANEVDQSKLLATNEKPFTQGTPFAEVEAAQKQANQQNTLEQTGTAPEGNVNDQNVGSQERLPVATRSSGREIPDYNQASNRGIPRNNNNGMQLPNPNRNGGQIDVGDEGDEDVQPLRPPIGSLGLEPKRNSQTSDPNDPSEESGTGQTQTDTPPVPEKKTGTIDIRVRKGTETSGGSQDIGSSTNGSEAVMRSARERHLAGQYDGAAKSYEKARELGKDDGKVNQNLGMVYEKLNRKSDAAAAYQRAISKLEDDVRKGKAGSKEALEATKQALKNLKG